MKTTSFTSLLLAGTIITSFAGCKQTDKIELQKACLHAKLSAINRCIAEYENHKKHLIAQSKQTEIRQIDSRLEKLNTDLLLTSSVAPENFQLSEPIIIKGRWGGRSITPIAPHPLKGPWYVIMGSKTPVKENKKYTFKLIPLYSCCDPNMTCSYVYVYVVDH